eukprot:EG_transcript_22729
MPTTWTAVLNVSSINEYWSPRGLTLFEGAVPWPVVKFEVSLRGALADWMQAANSALVAASKQNVTPHVGYPPSLMIVGEDPAILSLFVEITRSLQFTDQLKGLAERIISHLQLKAGRFVGVHLRVETDFLHHPYLRKDPVHQKKCRHGAAHCFDHLYAPAFQKAGLSPSSPPMYVASGIFFGERHLLPDLLP